MERAGIAYTVTEGGGAFYAPKIDVHVRDAIGRRWQVSTIQVDFQMPQRFDMEYVGADNGRHQPYMIHRALFGSVERFFAILLEHYAGAFPLWMSPVQAQVLPVRDDHDAYAASVVEHLRAAGFRAGTWPADEPLGARVRRAKLEKVPYVLVVGDDDVAAGTVGVNSRQSERPERGVGLADLIERLRAEAGAGVAAGTERPWPASTACGRGGVSEFVAGSVDGGSTPEAGPGLRFLRHPGQRAAR